MSTTPGLPSLDHIPAPQYKPDLQQVGRRTQDGFEGAQWESHEGTGWIPCSIHGQSRPFKPGVMVCAACVTEGIIPEDRALGRNQPGEPDRLEILVRKIQVREMWWGRMFQALVDEGREEDAKLVLELTNKERVETRIIRTSAEKLYDTDRALAFKLLETVEPDSMSTPPEVARAAGIAVPEAGEAPPPPSPLDPPRRPAVAHGPAPGRVPAPDPVDAAPQAPRVVVVVHEPHGEPGALVEAGGMEDFLERWIEDRAVQ